MSETQQSFPRPQGSPPARSSRFDRLVWIARLTFAKMREGPGPWLRAVRRGLFDTLPAPLKASLARRRFRLPLLEKQRLEMAGSVVERADHCSVILPVYNQADLLAASIDSVLAQVDVNFELIVLDDGSTDGIDAVFARYRGHPRVRLLTQQNRRLPAALTNAFRFADGEFRSWTSADNLMEPRLLERLVAYLRAHPTTAMVYGDYVVIDAHGEPLRGSDFRPQNRRSPESAEVRLPRDTGSLNLLQDNFIGACFAYRGWVGRCLGPYSSAMGIEDYDYWMRINAEFGIEHLGTDELLYRYRWHDNSLNAQAKELELFEVGQRLMEHERRRAHWRAEPIAVFADEANRGWLTELSGPDETVRDVADVDAASSGKQMVVIRCHTIRGGVLDRLPSGVVAAIDWSGDGATREVYRWASQLRDERLLHFATDASTLQALALFTDRVFEIERGRERLALARAFCNERVCAWRADLSENLPLPNVWRGAERRRLLLQADDFVQGGLECVVLDLAQGLRERGFDPLLLVLGERGAMAERAAEQGLEVVGLPAGERDPEAYAALLNERRIGLVMAHHSLFGATQAHTLGVPFVQTLHNTYHWFYPEEIEAWRNADAATTAYVHVSANVALYAHEKLGLQTTKSLVIENGVRLTDTGPTTDGKDLRESLGLAVDRFVFLNVASIYPPKSQVLIAAALAIARETEPRIAVVLLGRTMNERYAAELDASIAKLDLGDSLVKAGFRDDVDSFYAMADAFLLPSYWEGCSLAVAEALVRDLPCVLTDVGAARQQLLAAEGVVIDPPFASISELDFGNLENWLRQPRPGFVEELADAMVATARAGGGLAADNDRRTRFDIDAVVERYSRVLAWLEDGGSPAQARPFAWATQCGGELS